MGQRLQAVAEASRVARQRRTEGLARGRVVIWRSVEAEQVGADQIIKAREIVDVEQPLDGCTRSKSASAHLGITLIIDATPVRQSM